MSNRVKGERQFREVTRNLGERRRLEICVRAGGRCEFDGCNRNLFQAPVTMRDGVFGQIAHIIAFSDRGPRGSESSSSPTIHALENLMLLCHDHHKEIDDNPLDYSVETLRRHKEAHETRVRLVLDLGPAQATFVAVVCAPVARRAVAVTRDQVIAATAPRWPRNKEFARIDLGCMDDRSPSFIKAACDSLDLRLSELQRPGSELLAIGHLSLFALAPIPLLVHLGATLTDKVQVELYQRHRDTEDWTWKLDGAPAEYTFRRVSQGQGAGVALVLPLSGPIQLSDLPPPVVAQSTVYEIGLGATTPDTGFLRTRRDLERFVSLYQQALGEIRAAHGQVTTIDLFPAVPAPVAVACGRGLLPKVSPALRVFDYEKGRGGFNPVVEVNVDGH